MARPSGNADRLMLAAGKKIAREKGCSALRIREVVDSAGVNLGMFHYHFTNRKRFTRVLLAEVYGDFFDRLSQTASSGPDPVSELRESVLLTARFMRDERKLLAALLRDILNGDLEVIRYSKEKLPPHVIIFQNLIARCQREKLLPKLPLWQILPLFFGAIGQPLLIVEVLQRAQKSLTHFNPEVVLSDRAIAERVDIVLRGLRASVA